MLDITVLQLKILKANKLNQLSPAVGFGTLAPFPDFWFQKCVNATHQHNICYLVTSTSCVVLCVSTEYESTNTPLSSKSISNDLMKRKVTRTWNWILTMSFKVAHNWMLVGNLERYDPYKHWGKILRKTAWHNSQHSKVYQS